MASCVVLSLCAWRGGRVTREGEVGVMEQGLLCVPGFVFCRALLLLPGTFPTHHASSFLSPSDTPRPWHCPKERRSVLGDDRPQAQKT